MLGAPEKVACNFKLNIPGETLYSGSFGLKMSSHDDYDSPENKCITCDCDIDEICYQEKSVMMKRIGKNVFRFSTTS